MESIASLARASVAAQCCDVHLSIAKAAYTQLLGLVVPCVGSHVGKPSEVNCHELT